jgi:hypothetical protein
LARLAQMCVQVKERGQQQLAASVDHAPAGRVFQARGGSATHARDATALEHDVCLNVQVAARVEGSHVANDEQFEGGVHGGG